MGKWAADLTLPSAGAVLLGSVRPEQSLRVPGQRGAEEAEGWGRGARFQAGRGAVSSRCGRTGSSEAPRGADPLAQRIMEASWDHCQPHSWPGGPVSALTFFPACCAEIISDFLPDTPGRAWPSSSSSP